MNKPYEQAMNENAYISFVKMNIENKPFLEFLIEMERIPITRAVLRLTLLLLMEDGETSVSLPCLRSSMIENANYAGYNISYIGGIGLVDDTIPIRLTA